MANLVKNNQVQQHSQQEILSSKYHSARHNILLVVAFTLINIFLLVTNSNSYFLFSASIPYMIVDLGMALCGKYPPEYYEGELYDMEFMNDTFFIITLAVAAVFLLLYLFSWIFSKKPRVGWMIFALVFFVIDTVGMLALVGISSDAIMDIVFHGWVIFSLANGVISYFKLKKLPEPEMAEADGAAEQNPVYQSSHILRIADTEEKARILLEAETAGHKIVYRRVKKTNELVIDGNVYDEYEALVETAHTLRAVIGGQTIEAGMDTASHSFIQVDGQTVERKLRWF